MHVCDARVGAFCVLSLPLLNVELCGVGSCQIYEE